MIKKHPKSLCKEAEMTLDLVKLWENPLFPHDKSVKYLDTDSLRGTLSDECMDTYMIEVFLHRRRHINQIVQIHRITLQLLHSHYDAGL